MPCCVPAPDVAKSVPRLPEDNYFDYSGGTKWFLCDPTGEMPPRLAEKGFGGPDVTPDTLPNLLIKASKIKGSKPALLVERPCPALQDGKAPPALPREQWKTWTIKQYCDDCRNLAKAFISLGFQMYDTVNIWGFNSPEWYISALAGMFAGGKCGGIYPTDTADTAGYKVVHSGGVVVCVETEAHYDKVCKALSSRAENPRVKGFVAWGYEPVSGTGWSNKGGELIPMFGWKDMLAMGANQAETELEARLSNTKPGNCATLIYTSGTTGDPKAVMASHDGLIYVSATVVNIMGRSTGLATTADEVRILSYLPLSHVAGLLIDILSGLCMNALSPASCASFFARSYDLKVGSIGDRLRICRPSIFLGVPLVWEKLADRIRAVGAASGGLKKQMSNWAKGKAAEYANNLRMGGTGAVPNNLCLALKLLGAVKGVMGLDQCKFALTGAAPIRADTTEYFASLGIYINEAYGMSESTGVVTMSTEQAHDTSCCGWQMPGTEVKIFKVDPADFNKKTECDPAPTKDNTDEQYQGEICFRGRGIMMGYLASRDFGEKHVAEIEKKTAETIDEEGWCHSGDKGLKTQGGLVRITGRYKELIIGEGGENIAPVPIEDSVKALCDGINECMMIGDQRKYNVCFITLKAVGANGETPGTDQLDAGAKRVNPNVTTISGAMKDPKWEEAIKAAINATNANGKLVPNNAFKIQKFCILPENFSEEKDQLTPTKKLKRKKVEAQYAKMIDKMYATDGMNIPYENFDD